MTGLINRNVGCDNALDELAPAYLVIFLGSRNMIITPGGNQRCPVQGVPLIETVQPLTGSINQLEILSKRWPTTLARCNNLGDLSSAKRAAFHRPIASGQAT